MTPPPSKLTQQSTKQIKSLFLSSKVYRKKWMKIVGCMKSWTRGVFHFDLITSQVDFHWITLFGPVPSKWSSNGHFKQSFSNSRLGHTAFTMVTHEKKGLKGEKISFMGGHNEHNLKGTFVPILQRTKLLRFHKLNQERH